jgi:hypothetical protein
MARLLSRLRDFGIAGLPPSLLTWSQRVCEQIEAQFGVQQSQITTIATLQADQASQLATINAILDPDTLTPDKKPVWIFMESYLTGEQSDLDAKATSYGITTEKSAYDTAVSALTSYLGGLTSPVAWNDTSGNTSIVDATFRSKFTDVLTAKQALINAITAAAKTLANAAQTTANSAQSSADTVHSNDSISSSWTSPGTILTASDAGSSATITVANHTRKYNDASSKSVTGANITGLAYSTTYFVYYDDSSRAGGSVSYNATTDPNAALPGAASGRHYCGEITTPASGGGSTSGGVSPPGSGGQLSGGQIP